VRRLAGGVDRLLVDVGADVNARDVDGWTPMHAAAHWGQDDACKLLAELRASLSAPRPRGIVSTWRRGVVVSGVRRARLVLGWVTVFGRVYHLGM